MVKKLGAVLWNLGMGLVGSLWLFVGSQDPAARLAFIIFGIVTVACSLAHLCMLGDWRRKTG